MDPIGAINGQSVFEALMRSCKHDGEDMESTATSASPKWIEGEKLARLGMVNSAERRKPKKGQGTCRPKHAMVWKAQVESTKTHHHDVISNWKA